MPQRSDFVVWLSEINEEDIYFVGKKAGSLGEIANLNIPIPDGFVVTINAYHQFLLENNLITKIKHLLETADRNDNNATAKTSETIKKIVLHADVPNILLKEIFHAYRKLGGLLMNGLVNVFSSSLNEYRKSYLNVKGEANLVQKVREIWASLFEAGDFKIGTAVVVQKVIKFEKLGVMLTDKTKIVIEEPNEAGNRYEVSKSDLKIIGKIIKRDSKQILTDRQTVTLAFYGKKIEKYYYFPQNIEWLIEKNEIYINNTRPIIIEPQIKDSYTLQPKRHVLTKGRPAYPGIATGYVRIIQYPHDVDKVLPGEIVVIPYTNLAFNQAIKKAGAIVIESKFHHTSYLKTNIRFSGKPTIITESRQAAMLRNGLVVTVNGTKGVIYKGQL